MATYYIDYAGGNDANNGTAKLTPWKTHPYMANTAIVGYSHSAGDQFIFKGGVTWLNVCFPMTIAAGGSAEGTRDYYGIDATWYTGGAWARPIFDMEDTETATRNQVLNIGTSTAYITFDNLEITRFYWTGASSWPYDHMIHYEAATYMLFKNLYVHSWSHGAAGAGTTDDAMVFCGQTSNPFNTGTIIEYCTIDGSRVSDSMYASYGGSMEIRFCTIHDVSNGPASAYSDPATHAFHDNEIYNIVDSFGAVHENAMSFTKGGKVYNNVLHDLASGMIIYVYVAEGGSQGDLLVYNNVVYAVSGEALNNGCICIDPSGDYTGTARIFNNTLVKPDGSPCVNLPPRGFTLADLQIQNNHMVTTGDAVVTAGNTYTSYTEDHNLEQTQAQATADGYIAATEYAPVAGGGGIDVGTSEAGYFTTDILGLTRPKGAAWDIGAYEYNDPKSPYVRFY
jgi:hypothetical protein